MNLSEFKFDLPAGLLALYPAENRDESQLPVLNRSTGETDHRIFKDVVRCFSQGNVMVSNNTKVFPARLCSYKLYFSLSK